MVFEEVGFIWEKQKLRNKKKLKVMDYSNVLIQRNFGEVNESKT
jgi:hypothetical protein